MKIVQLLDIRTGVIYKYMIQKHCETEQKDPMTVTVVGQKTETFLAFWGITKKCLILQQWVLQALLTGTRI